MLSVSLSPSLEGGMEAMAVDAFYPPSLSFSVKAIVCPSFLPAAAGVE
jgi:hypothetical protein